MTAPVRVLVCSDFHASERTWRKFLNALQRNVYNVDLALVAGDLTGKALVPIVESADKGWRAEVLGTPKVARDEKELLVLERSIADVGFYSARLTIESHAELASNPDTLREAFIAAMRQRLADWLSLAAERLEGTNIPLLLMPGNDDDFEIDGVLATSAYASNVNERVVDITPWHQLVSMGWSSPTPWTTPRELPEEEFLDRLSDLMQGVSAKRRTVMMTHVPPHNSGLDTAPLLRPDLRPRMKGGMAEVGPVGSVGVRQAIERFKPVLGVHGHIHESGGHRRLGETVVVNAGSDSNQGVLRALLVDLSSDGVERVIRVEG